MKRVISLLTAGLSAIVISLPVKAQEYYWSHPYTPYELGNAYYSYTPATISISSGYLNGRQGPSTDYIVISSFYRGERVSVLRSSYNNSDGKAWYLVVREADGSRGWVRGDFLRF